MGDQVWNSESRDTNGGRLSALHWGIQNGHILPRREDHGNAGERCKFEWIASEDQRQVPNGRATTHQPWPNTLSINPFRLLI